MTATVPLFHDAQASPSTALDLTELIELVRTFALSEDLWRPRLQLPAAGGERWWTQLHGDQRVDVWLLAWQPGHFTDLHDHGSSAAAFSVVRGELAEYRVERSGQNVTLDHRAGSTTWMAPGVVHDVRAVAAPSVSIHAYSPPLTEMTYYQPLAAGQLRPIETVRTTNPEQRPGS